ncbi:AAEL013699-PA [Aedes aegypti]|uniref:AAEL013699-PA n=2 Tax=Aedes aegypti TaxID=7159 RepID=Q16IE8_AEDAE|nr:AAEL013699-PA [Aedes aegypti]
MREREIDREENANQTIMYQKSVQQRDTDSEVGRWADLVRRRALRIADLRREFQGWHGNHERHCILHDVLLA